MPAAPVVEKDLIDSEKLGTEAFHNFVPRVVDKSVAGIWHQPWKNYYTPWALFPGHLLDGLVKTDEAKPMHALEVDNDFGKPRPELCTSVLGGNALLLSLTGFPGTFSELAQKIYLLPVLTSLRTPTKKPPSKQLTDYSSETYLIEGSSYKTSERLKRLSVQQPQQHRGREADSFRMVDRCVRSKTAWPAGLLLHRKWLYPFVKMGWAWKVKQC